MRRSSHPTPVPLGAPLAASASGRLARPVAMALLGCLLAATPAWAQGAPKDAPPVTEADLARLERTTSVLEKEVELARGQRFYLVLDPAGAELSLRLRGAELQRYPVLGLQVGRPRVSWISRQDPKPWQGVIWSEGALDPPREEERTVVTSGEEAPDAAPKPVEIPKTAEELYVVPSRFHVRFTGGLSIEIRPHEADEDIGRFARLRAWWSAKWRDVAAAWRADGRDVVRLRIVLDPADAESLYRALPPDASLLVLPGALPAR